MKLNFTPPLFIWFLALTLFYFAFYYLRPYLMQFYARIQDSWGLSKKIKQHQVATHQVIFLQETLSSGLVPELHDWNRLTTLPEPWNKIAARSVSELRDQGAPVLPTLKRIRTALEEQVELMQESRAKSSQAWSQAWLGGMLVPVFSTVLYLLLPELQASRVIYFAVTGFSLLLVFFSIIWISILIDQARFGGVKSEHQSWYSSTLAAIERLWALISTGLPPDLAWKSMIEELAHTDATFAKAWGATVWKTEAVPTQNEFANEFERLMLNLGTEMRKSIQVSLVEGRGCLDRIESIHRAFLTEYRLNLTRKLNILPNQCLKPLFLLLFPAVFLLLFTGLALSVGGLT